MSNELWNHVWIASEKTGQAYYVANYNCGPGEMTLEKHGEDEISVYTVSKSGYIEIPPVPDTIKLRKQGYRLTGIAADCSVQNHDAEVVWAHAMYVYSSDPRCITTADRTMWNGWRWLVERIDFELEASEARIQQVTTDFGTTDDELPADYVSDEYHRGFTDGMKGGYNAAREEAIGIISAMKEKSFE